MSDVDVVNVYATLSQEKRFVSNAVPSLFLIENVKSVGQVATVSEEETLKSSKV